MASCGRSSVISAYPDELAGVGVILQAEASSGEVVVAQLIPTGPASTVGLRVGDRIKAIDGESTQGRPLADVVSRLRGLPGSDVAIAVDEGPSGRTVFSVKRQAMARSGNSGTYEAR